MGKVDTHMNYEQQAKSALVGAAQQANYARNIAREQDSPAPNANLSEVVESLDVSISNLQERINFLAERLTPVLRQTASSGLSAGPQEHNAVILNIFEQQTFRIRQLLNQTQDMIERLVL